MAIQTSSSATNANLTRFEKKYREGADIKRIYDQFAGRLEPTWEPAGTTISVLAYTELVPRPTTDIGSETSDFDPQTFGDVKASVTLQWYADGLKMHELAQLKSSYKPELVAAKLVGMNMMESVDALARRAATEAGIVFYGGTRASRVTLDVTTSTDWLTIANFQNVAQFASIWNSEKNAEGKIFCVVTPDQYMDLLRDTATATANLITVSNYNIEGARQMLYNAEVGMLAGIRIVASPQAKFFYGAGAVRSSSYATTLAAASAAGDTAINSTNTTNMLANQWINIGTKQTSTESDDTILTEAAWVLDTTTATSVKLRGSGPFGGLRYAHASGKALNNGTTVHCAVFGGPSSLVKAYSGMYGEYGQLISDDVTGNARQWHMWAWKWFGGYGLLNDTALFRIETAGSKR